MRADLVRHSRRPAPSVRGARRRPKTAYHEAGHCLARLWMGHRFHAAIVRKPVEAAAGPILDRRNRLVDCEGFVDAYDIVSPFLSPKLLEETRFGVGISREEYVAGCILSAEMEIIDCVSGIAAEVRFSRQSWFSAVLDGGTSDWEKATSVAAIWFPDAAGAAVEAACDRARALVRAPASWRAIELMAARLLACGRMDQGDAELDFTAAFGRKPPGRNDWTAYWPPPPDAFASAQMPEMADA